MIDGCLLASFRGPEAPAWLLRRLEGGLGGVCLFGDNIADAGRVAELTRPCARPPERRWWPPTRRAATSPAWRWRPAAPSRATPRSGAIDDDALTQAVATSIGAELAAAGVTLDLAPCVDVNSNPANPVIGVRSFGADPQLVGRHGAAFVRGLQAAGVAACAKHFPGHGDTAATRTWTSPSCASRSRSSGTRELAPFRAVIAAGVDAVMTSHVVLPALDDRPATTSRRVLVELLRRRAGLHRRHRHRRPGHEGRERHTVHRRGRRGRPWPPAPTCSASAPAGRGRARPRARRRRGSGRRRPAGRGPPGRGGGAGGPARCAHRPERRAGATASVGRAAARRALRVEGAPCDAVPGRHVVELRPARTSPPARSPGGSDRPAGPRSGRHRRPRSRARGRHRRRGPGRPRRAAAGRRGPRPAPSSVAGRAPRPRWWRPGPDAIVVDMGWPGPRLRPPHLDHDATVRHVPARRPSPSS